jgi:hypothetical protein
MQKAHSNELVLLRKEVQSSCDNQLTAFRNEVQSNYDNQLVVFRNDISEMQKAHSNELVLLRKEIQSSCDNQLTAFRNELRNEIHLNRDNQVVVFRNEISEMQKAHTNELALLRNEITLNGENRIAVLRNEVLEMQKANDTQLASIHNKIAEFYTQIKPLIVSKPNDPRKFHRLEIFYSLVGDKHCYHAIRAQTMSIRRRRSFANGTLIYTESSPNPINSFNRVKDFIQCKTQHNKIFCNVAAEEFLDLMQQGILPQSRRTQREITHYFH